MANVVKALKVSLKQEGFCVATGPHDSGVVYPRPARPFAPLLTDSPVALHLYCPDVFPGEVLKLHAEHLGHFLALQSVPKIDRSLELTLFEGLCRMFTRDAVLSAYGESLTDGDLRATLDAVREGAESHPEVFVNFAKSQAKDVLSLLRNLLGLFDKDKLCDDIPHVAGREPDHMLFLYLIQLSVVFVSICIGEKDLATIMSVASSVFLEANSCHPLCAATILKPMFVPYYEQSCKPRAGKKTGAGEEARDDCEARLRYYRLFSGYELDANGSDVSEDQQDLSWTERGLLARVQGDKIVERQSKKLWFVAPQMGDRLAMVKEHGLRMMGGQTGDKALKIASYLVSDNVMAYLQSAAYGTVRNMLPCHANSDFTESVMNKIEGSMSAFSEVARHQSSFLMTELRSVADTCLRVTGVGFSGQDKGASLHFGKVYTGPEDKRPQQNQSNFGVFTSVSLGVAGDTMMSAMLAAALDRDPKGAGLRAALSAEYKPAAPSKVTVTDVYVYARYHHWFNRGEFTEVANVKNMGDPGYNSLIHEEKLTNASKYQLTVCHGALPMCVLTLAMTLRQAVIMVTGFACAELARVAHASAKVAEVNLCKSLTSLTMAGKFKHRKDEESTNTFEASYGDLLKFTGPVFTNSARKCTNLDGMDWLRADDPRLPDYLRRSLTMIGGTRQEVERIMREKDVSYAQVVFVSNNRKMDVATLYENEEYMVHAPLMTLCTLRLFSNSTCSYASVKLSRRGSYYPVKVFSNRCVDTQLYYKSSVKDLDCLASTAKSTVLEVVELIRREVSCVLPRIHADRIKMLAPDLSEEELALLVSAVKSDNIEVVGELRCSDNRGASRSPCAFPPEPSEKRTGDETGRESPEPKRFKPVGGTPQSTERDPAPSTSGGKAPDDKPCNPPKKLTIFDADIDFGFDDSD